MTHAALRATRKHTTTGADAASYETGTSPGPGVTGSVATRAARRRNAGESVEVLSVLLTIEDGTKAPDIRQGISPPRFRVSPQDGNQR